MHLVVVGRLEVGRPVLDEVVGEARVQGEAPDGRGVDPGGPQQIEAVALGLRQGLLVGEDRGGAGLVDAERADHPVGRMALGGGHPVGVERRGGVADQDPVVLPLRQQMGGVLVTIETRARVGFGELDPDRICTVPLGELDTFVRCDDVVGRRDHHGEIGTRRVVTQSAERIEARHGHCVAHRRSRPRAGRIERGASVREGLVAYAGPARLAIGRRLFRRSGRPGRRGPSRRPARGGPDPPRTR